DHLLRIVAGHLPERRAPAAVGGRHADRAVEAAGAKRVKERVARVELHLPHRAGVRERQDGLRPVRGRDAAPPACDLGERLVPGDRFEPAFALGADTPQRSAYAQRRVHAFGIVTHLAADHALREWVRSGAGDVDDRTVLDADVEAAAGRTIMRAHRVHERILDYDAADVRAH